MKRACREYRFRTFADDVVVNSGQEHHITDDFVYLHESGVRSGASNAAVSAIRPLAWLGCRPLHLSFVGRELLEGCVGGFMLFANHTQPVGDALWPLVAVRRKRPFYLVSEANLGLPVLGGALPFLGAIPIGRSVANAKGMREAVLRRLEDGDCVVVYPEAHVWPYYTDIRPFPDTAFRFPIDAGVPAFCATAVYRAREGHERPAMTIYLDGPFRAPAAMPKRAARTWLHDAVYDQMKQRARLSDCAFVRYRRVE